MSTRTTLFFAAMLSIGMHEAGRADIISFAVQMDSDQAAACAGTGSPHTGSGTMTLDTDTGVVNYSISFTGLTSPETVAHTHGAAPVCINAAALHPLVPGNPKIGSYVVTPAQQADMLAGLHYVNIHSQMHPGGEIRGQLLRVESVPTTSTWGIVLLSLVLLVVAKSAFGFRRVFSTQ